MLWFWERAESKVVWWDMVSVGGGGFGWLVCLLLEWKVQNFGWPSARWVRRGAGD